MQKKYNFIPEHQLNCKANDEVGFKVNIAKGGFLYFGSFTVEMWNLNKKFIRLYADKEKKSIAWTELHDVKEDDLEAIKKKKVRQLNYISPTQKAIKIKISKILDEVGVTEEMLPIKHIPVTEYSDSLIAGKLNVVDLADYFKVPKYEKEEK